MVKHTRYTHEQIREYSDYRYNMHNHDNIIRKVYDAKGAIYKLTRLCDNPKLSPKYLELASTLAELARVTYDEIVKLEPELPRFMQVTSEVKPK